MDLSPLRAGPADRPRVVAVAAGAALACLGWVVLLPVGNNRLLLPVLALLGASALVLIVFGRTKVAPDLHLIAWLALIVGGLGLLAGAMNPGLSNGLFVAILIPVYWWLCASSLSLRAVRPVLTVIASATVIGGVGILVFVAGASGLTPQIVPVWLQEFVGAGYAGNGSVAIRFYGLSSFVATAPMWLTASALPRSAYLPPRALCLAAAGASLAAVFLGGRRAIVVVALIVPVLVLAVRLVLKVRRGELANSGRRLTALGAASLAILAAAFTLPPVREAGAGVVSLVTGRGKGEAEVLRAEQAEALLRDWQRSPFFGNGWGTGVDGYQRFVDRPWVYELQYHYLLAQVGLVGLMIVLAALVVGIRMVARAANLRPDVAPALYVASAGAVAMLIANASNPYLRVPGHVWAVVLPLAVASAVLASGRGVTTETGEPSESRLPDHGSQGGTQIGPRAL